MELKKLIKKDPLFLIYIMDIIFGFPLLLLLKGDELVRISALYLIVLILFVNHNYQPNDEKGVELN